MQVRNVNAVLLLIGFFASVSLASLPAEQPNGGDFEEELIAAYSEEGSRDVLVRQVVLDAFRDASFERDALLLEYLFQNHQFLDLWFLADAEGLVNDKRQKYLIMYLLGENRLTRMDSGERESAYRKALLEDGYEMSERFLLTRSNAVHWASADGCADLWPLIEKYYPELGTNESRYSPIEYLKITMELRKGDKLGACGGASAAIARVSSMSAGEVETAMGGLPHFQRAVLSAARLECQINPFEGRPEGDCVAVRDLAARQRSFRNQAVNDDNPDLLQPDMQSESDWLTNLERSGATH